MKLEKIIFGQAIQFFLASPTTSRKSPLPLIKEMQNRYGFVEVPTKATDLNFETGVNFVQGYYNDTIINKFQVYNTGILCEAAADNIICDQFLQEVLDWAIPYFNPINIEKRSKAFQSKLEISSTKNIQSAFSKYSEIGKLISGSLEGYGLDSPPYVAAGLVMMHEPQKNIPSNPNFEFAWRAERPFSDLVYYSSAPLRTQDHLRVLDRLEEIL